MSLLDTASLIVTPNGYKEGKLYSVIPSDGSGDLSVTRATTATRVNSQGLVELVPYNLLQYSEDFSNGAWISGEVSLTSGQSSPLGTNTAFKITGTSATNAFLLQVGIPVTSGNTYTASVYLKGSTSGSVSLRVDSGSTSPNNPVSYTTEWQRFTYTFTAGSTTATAILGGYNTWTGSEEIFVYGFQLVEGSVAKDYQKTETRLNIPRLDYSNGTCPSLLVEPQRTNSFKYSEDFSNVLWLKGDSAITANVTTAPNGISNADLLYPTSSGDYRYVYQIQTQISSVYTSTIYAKAQNKSKIWMYVESSATYGICYFDLINGTIQSTTLTGSIEDVGNGWYRCSVTTATALPLVSGSGFGVCDALGSPYVTANGTDGVYLWGAQLEAGSYATSYIPTTSASVTRNADVISKTGISSLIGQQEGTVFFDGMLISKQNPYANILNTNKDVTNVSSFSIVFDTSSWKIVFSLFKGNGTYDTFLNFNSFGNFYNGQRVKIAARYKSGDSALYINGLQQATSTASFSVNGTKNELFIVDPTIYFGYQEPTECNAVALWKQGLTNAQLATLTTI